MRRIATSARPYLASFALTVLAAPAIHAQTPIDLLDPTPRDVLVHVEGSSDRAIVGQSFGSGFPATYSASGNIGTLVVSAATHEQIRASFVLPVPNSFSPIVIDFDLTTFEAASAVTGGAWASGQITGSFSQGALTTSTVAGFMGPDVVPLFCTSQAQVDTACMFVPMFCGQACTIVPGEPFDTQTGLVNLVGSEFQSGCDGALCSGPFEFFSQYRDLLVTELPETETSNPFTTGALIAIFAALAAVALVRAGRVAARRS